MRALTRSRSRIGFTEYGLVPEEYGGDTMFVDVSAITGVGLDALLEAVILTADAALDLRANPEMDGQGVAIEAHLDKGRGPVATVLVQRGTLAGVGDSIVAGTGYGRVRALLDDHGHNVDDFAVVPGFQVLGLTAVPGAGDSLLVVDDDRMARQIAERRASPAPDGGPGGRRPAQDAGPAVRPAREGRGQELRLILKGDGAGSVEALEDALAKIDVGDEVSLRVIDRGVGAITETNVSLAAASNAVIVGFNVRPQGKATELADREGVDIRYYSVIYAAYRRDRGGAQGSVQADLRRGPVGQAEIREIFRSSRAGIIAGCMVLSGSVRRNSKARLLREGVVIAETAIATLRREKDDATEVREGFECGITLQNYSDIRSGDVIETFEMRREGWSPADRVYEADRGDPVGLMAFGAESSGPGEISRVSPRAARPGRRRSPGRRSQPLLPVAGMRTRPSSAAAYVVWSHRQRCRLGQREPAGGHRAGGAAGVRHDQDLVDRVDRGAEPEEAVRVGAPLPDLHEVQPAAVVDGPGVVGVPGVDLCRGAAPDVDALDRVGAGAASGLGAEEDTPLGASTSGKARYPLL